MGNRIMVTASFENCHVSKCSSFYTW